MQNLAVLCSLLMPKRFRWNKFLDFQFSSQGVKKIIKIEVNLPANKEKSVIFPFDFTRNL